MRASSQGKGRHRVADRAERGELGNRSEAPRAKRRSGGAGAARGRLASSCRNRARGIEAHHLMEQGGQLVEERGQITVRDGRSETANKAR